MSPRRSVPACLRRSCSVLKSNSTTRRADVAFFASFSPSALSLPFTASRPPLEVPLACKEAIPAISGAVPANAEARLSCAMSSVTESGVNDTSVPSIGPAFPSSLISPPPTTLALNENGNSTDGANSRTSRFTLSRASGFCRPLVLPSEKRPSTILTSLALRSRLSFADGSGADEAGGPDVPPMLE